MRQASPVQVGWVGCGTVGVVVGGAVGTVFRSLTIHDCPEISLSPHIHGAPIVIFEYAPLSVAVALMMSGALPE